MWCTFDSKSKQEYTSDQLRKMSALQTKVENKVKQHLVENLAHREIPSWKKIFFCPQKDYILVLKINSGLA